MNNYRQPPRYRRRRLSGRFYALLVILVLGVVAYFVVTNVIGLEDNDEPPPYNGYQNGHGNGEVGYIDISELYVLQDHIRLVYAVNNIEDGMGFRVVDPFGLLRETVLSPRDRQVRLYSDLPIVLELGENNIDYVNIYVHRPRDVYERVVVIDAGHGGGDGGAPVAGVIESHLTLAIALRLYDLFAESDSGITAFMTRREDVFVSNTQRSAFINRVGHLAVSIHTNTYHLSSVSGSETLYSTNGHPQSNILAQIVVDHLSSELGTRNRGIFTRTDLYILNATRLTPTTIAEIDFKTNPAARANLQSPAYQQRVAQALYDAIVYAFERVFD